MFANVGEGSVVVPINVLRYDEVTRDMSEAGLTPSQDHDRCLYVYTAYENAFMLYDI